MGRSFIPTLLWRRNLQKWTSAQPVGMTQGGVMSAGTLNFLLSSLEVIDAMKYSTAQACYRWITVYRIECHGLGDKLRQRIGICGL